MIERPRANIRLACMYCDRDDFDGVSMLPDNWRRIDEVQSYKESIQTEECESILDWFTHLGACPKCHAIDNPGS